MSQPSHNYLRTYRKRAGLSQDEVAFLLGVRHGTKVSRYERGTRQAGLETALAYEIIFGAPPRRVFAGLFGRVKVVVNRRARALIRKLSGGARTPHTSRKLELLSTITSGSVSAPDQEL